MHLKTELLLKQARLKEVKVKLSEEDPKVSLVVRARLTPEVAEAFGCRELIYVGETPRSGVDKMALEGDEIDCGIHIQNDNFAFAATANSIGHYVAKFEGTGPVLEMEIKMVGYAGILTDVAEKVKVDPVELILKPAQMNLDLKKPGAGGEGEVDDSERLISPEQAADTAEADGEAVLAPAAVMGGTHQKGTKGRRPRRVQSIAEPIEGETEDVPENDSPDFMAELGVDEVVN